MMACGLPLIEFDGKNTRETYPENSVFFSKPDPLELANVIETALSNKDLSMMVRNNALDFVKNLSWEKSVKLIEKGFLQV
jgi:glycosyltransferase involved in cell wall biosynthesis